MSAGSPDHPRACGANVDLGYDGGASVGSSPRMRGKLRHAGGLPASERIIPAHAGQTTIFSFNSARWSDHPRACGANGVWGVFNIRGHGSSPRMRGKLFHNCSVLCFVRIIPAHAGQTMVAGRHSTPSTDHPRACGANAWRRDCRRAIYGSSPRMRGKPEHRHPGHGHRRIIPAHAGQTSPHAIMPPRSTDHPRACGANYNGTYSTFDDLGSSPRMRGKLTADAGDTHSRRIIPAHAGQTDLDKFYGDVNADHPRACGANGEALHVKRRLDGSSPRMRGKLGHRHRRYGRARIIPAHAGQTRPRPRTPVSPTDHPRACGAN